MEFPPRRSIPLERVGEVTTWEVCDEVEVYVPGPTPDIRAAVGKILAVLPASRWDVMGFIIIDVTRTSVDEDVQWALDRGVNVAEKDSELHSAHKKNRIEFPSKKTAD